MNKFKVVMMLIFCVSSIYVKAHEIEDIEHLQASDVNVKAKRYDKQFEEYSIPDVSLLNQNGERISLLNLIAQRSPVLLNFIFTSCPTICPVLTSTLSKLQRKFESDQTPVTLISISIDPEFDSPSRLQEYASKFNTNNNWTFLTGTAKDIKHVLRAFESFRGDKMNHAPVLLIRNNEQKKWLRIEGFPSAAEVYDEYIQINST